MLLICKCHQPAYNEAFNILIAMASIRLREGTTMYSLAVIIYFKSLTVKQIYFGFNSYLQSVHFEGLGTCCLTYTCTWGPPPPCKQALKTTNSINAGVINLPTNKAPCLENNARSLKNNYVIHPCACFHLR